MNIKEQALPSGRYPTPFAASPLGTHPMPILPVDSDAAGRQKVETHLTKLGIDEADAPFYVDAVQQGGVLVIVTTDDRQEAKTSRDVMKALDVTQMASKS